MSRAAAPMIGQADLAGEVIARGEIGGRQCGAAVSTFDAEEGAGTRVVAHALHNEPIVLGGETAFTRLEGELQVIKAEPAEAVRLHWHPFDAHARHFCPRSCLYSP